DWFFCSYYFFNILEGMAKLPNVLLFNKEFDISNFKGALDKSYKHQRGDKLMTQYFIKNYVGSIFDNGKMPKLLYICDVDHDYTKMPRIMHSHDDIVEFVFIREGRGNHVIGGKTYETKKGDVLIYNSRVIHDEIANPNT